LVISSTWDPSELGLRAVRTLLTIVGPCISASGFLPYMLATFRGTIRPRVASWATWSLVTGIATVAAFSDGAYASGALTAVATACELAILGFALHKGQWTYTWIDGSSQGISLAGMVGWLSTSNAIWAIVFSIIADFFGAVPTFHNGWTAPQDENWAPYVVSGAGAAVSFLAVKDVTVVSAAFPAYVAVFGPCLGSMIILRQRRARRAAAAGLPAAREQPAGVERRGVEIS